MKNYYKHFAVVMSIVLLVTGMTFPSATKAEAAAAKPTLSKKKLTVQVGKTKTLKLKNNKKKTKWTIVSGKGKVALKNKKKNSVKIVGKKKGTAKVQVKVGKKKYTCKITIQAAQSSGGKSKDTVNLPVKTKEPNYPLPSIKPTISRDEEDDLSRNIEVTFFILPQNAGVLMEVTNNNDTLVHCAKITYELFDAGVPVGNGSGEVYELAAGETRYEHDYSYKSSDNPTGIMGLCYVTVDQSNEYTYVAKYITASMVSEEPGKITLSIQNSYESAIDNVPVMIIFYDEYDNIVDVARNSVPGGINAGDTQILEVPRTAIGVDESGAYSYINYDHYRVIVNAYKF